MIRSSFFEHIFFYPIDTLMSMGRETNLTSLAFRRRPSHETEWITFDMDYIRPLPPKGGTTNNTPRSTLLLKPRGKLSHHFFRKRTMNAGATA